MTAEGLSILEHLGKLVSELRTLLEQAERDVRETTLAVHTLKLASAELEMKIRDLEGLIA